MADIEVSIIDGVANISQQGFGIPVVYGETEQYKVLLAGTGKSQLVFSSAARGGDANIVITTDTPFGFTASGSTVTLKIPVAGKTAKECYDEFQDNAPAPVLALVDLALSNSGSGLVENLVSTPLAEVTEFDLRDAADVAGLLPYYETTDPEYKMASALFSQDLKPEKVYVFNGFEDTTSVEFAEKILTFDNQDFYFILLTDTTKARAVEVANWADLNDKLLVALNEDATLLDDLSIIGSSAVVLTEDDSVRKDAMIVGVQAPKTPGSTTWKWKRANGATAETNTTLINAARDNNGNVFISTSGEIFFVEGKMTNGLFIDQKHSRDYMKARIAERFLALFLAEEKIPYDDGGITQLVSTLSDVLNSFGDGGIIARAVSQTEVENSFNNVYQYSITAPTRAQVIANSPTNITNRLYELEFEYVEAGAIHNLTVTGKVVLALV